MNGCHSNQSFTCNIHKNFIYVIITSSLIFLRKISFLALKGTLTGTLTLSWFNWWVSFAPEFQCCYFCESSCLFYLSFNFDFCVSKIMHL